MKMQEVFTKLDQLFDYEQKWAKNGFAWTAATNKCEPRELAACCWCFVGGLSRVTGQEVRLGACLFAEEFAEKVLETLPPPAGVAFHHNSIPSFNDDNLTTFKDVKRLIKACIDRAAAESL